MILKSSSNSLQKFFSGGVKISTYCNNFTPLFCSLEKLHQSLSLALQPTSEGVLILLLAQMGKKTTLMLLQKLHLMYSSNLQQRQKGQDSLQCKIQVCSKKTSVTKFHKIFFVKNLAFCKIPLKTCIVDAQKEYIKQNGD